MKYKYNDKFKIKNVNLDLEVLGCFPGGQQRTVQMKENSYKVLMNGCEVDITERNLDLLKESEIKEEEKSNKKEGETNGRPSRNGAR